MRLAGLAALFMTLLAIYGGGRLGAVWILSPTRATARERAVQQLQCTTNIRGRAFTLPLPTLERTPEGVPVEVVLETRTRCQLAAARS